MSGVEKRILKPKEYHKMISELDVENLELNTSSPAAAKITLAHLELVNKHLLEIKRNISTDMRAIKLKHLDKDNIKTSRLGPLSRRKSTADKRRALEKKREHALAPYNNLLFVIDDYLKQIENIKNFLNKL